MPNQYGMTEYDAEAESISQRRKLAQALALQSSQALPAGGMAGRFYVPTSPLSHLAQAINQYSAHSRMGELDQESRALGGRRSEALAAAISGMPRAQMQAQPTDMEGTGSFDMAGMNTPQKIVQPSMQDNAAWLGKLGGIGKDAVGMGGTILGMQQKADENEANRLARLQERLMVVQADASRRAEAADLRREIQTSQQAFAERQAERDRTFRDDQARQAAKDRQALVQSTAGKPQKAPVGYRFSSDGETLEPIAGGPKDPKAVQLPTQALKLQQGHTEAIGISAGLAKDLDALSKQIDEKKLDLGLFSNWINRGRNAVGISSEQSRNLGSFEATLERMRNDSLRLNKGVQTEGDAQRAWNELVKSINDPGLVKQRLAEIKEINERAVNLRKMDIDNIRSNYGAAPLDTAGYENQPAVVGSRGGASGGWSITPVK